MTDTRSTLASTLASAALDALGALRLADLTHALHAAMPYFPAKVPIPFERTQTASLDQGGVNSGRIAMSEHMGTHLDAPVHFVEGGMSVDHVPLAALVAPAVVIDISAAAAADDDYRLSPDDIAAWESAHGRVPAGCYALVDSGWAARWPEPRRYTNADASGVLHFPAVDPAAAQALVERGVLGIGIDTLSVDNALVGEEKGAAHKVLHGAGCFILENLARLDELPPRDVVLFIGALPIVHGTGGPARVLAYHRPT